MRVSSVMFPASSIGTLRSERMKTRRPARSRSSMRRMFMCLSLRLHQCERHVEHAVGEAPLVVVPGAHLHEAPRDLGACRVEDRRARIVVEIHRDEGGGAVAEDSLELAALGG